MAEGVVMGVQYHLESNQEGLSIESRMGWHLSDDRLLVYQYLGIKMQKLEKEIKDPLDWRDK
jgi:hypothetical protein